MNRISPIAMVVVSAVAGACKSQKVQSAGPPPATPVSVATVTQQTVPIEIHSVGRVEASAVIQVKSQVGGEIVRVSFAEGTNVRKGDLLFEIDPRPYQEALRQAEATLARDTAQLRQAQANLERDKAQLRSAEADAERNRQLGAEGLASKAQDEQSRATADAIRASIQADQAAIESSGASVESDRAAVERAKLDLSYCQIRSPISGRVGNLLIHQGNVVSANGNPLVVIHQVSPIWVSFNAPESLFSEIRRNSSARELPVRAVPRDTVGHPANGYLSVIDNTIDSATGTIHLKATFENRDRLLFPGQFTDVTLTIGSLERALVVPSEAVQPGQKGEIVFVVKNDRTVEARPVTPGATYGDKVVIQSGLAAGETVVTDGQLRLRPGMPVKIVPASVVDSKAL